MVASPRTPLRATWSSLYCLSSLTPPSPTLSPGNLAHSPVTSGEIPIFLDPGIQVRPTSPESPSPCRVRPKADIPFRSATDGLRLDLDTDLFTEMDDYATISSLQPVVRRDVFSKIGRNITRACPSLADSGPRETQRASDGETRTSGSAVMLAREPASHKPYEGSADISGLLFARPAGTSYATAPPSSRGGKGRQRFSPKSCNNTGGSLWTTNASSVVTASSVIPWASQDDTTVLRSRLNPARHASPTAPDDRSFSPGATLQPRLHIHPFDEEDETIQTPCALTGSESQATVSTYFTANTDGFSTIGSSESEQSFLSLDPDRASNASSLRSHLPDVMNFLGSAANQVTPSSLSSTNMAVARSSSARVADLGFPPPPRVSHSTKLTRRGGVRDARTRRSRSPTQCDSAAELASALSIIPVVVPPCHRQHLRTGSSSTTVSTRSHQSSYSNISEASTHSYAPQSGSSCAHVEPPLAVPAHLSWLNETSVELMIDQEGFRAVNPAFQLAAYTASKTAGSMCSLAHFCPVKPQNTYEFHYAKFDSYPGLYRLNVNGDEKRDHMTRHATLNIETPGVYTVSGNEPFRGDRDIPGEAFPSTGEGDEETLRLEWRFTYEVAKRKDHKGKDLAGERTLRPLSFVCSPMLLHPSQGRKVGLWGMAVKFVTPKLAAHKVDVPVAVTPRARAPFRGMENMGSELVPGWGHVGTVWGEAHLRVDSVISSEDGAGSEDERPLINRQGVHTKTASVGDWQRPTLLHHLVSSSTASALGDMPQQDNPSSMRAIGQHSLPRAGHVRGPTFTPSRPRAGSENLGAMMRDMTRLGIQNQAFGGRESA